MHKCICIIVLGKDFKKLSFAWTKFSDPISNEQDICTLLHMYEKQKCTNLYLHKLLAIMWCHVSSYTSQNF